ncbi:MAG: conjugal transfer protein TraL [Candidatus Adiutrix sp.]|jgi:hypothetical protein|nr:conjugal transfer protein TraL [Candidatus Adiutrix sp.]
MATIHLFLTGKGGVGKSFAAALLYQYLRKKLADQTDNPYQLVAYDTDPVNSTFAGYKEFEVTGLKIMDGDDIDPSSFDRLVDEICALNGEAQVIVDNGASCYVSLCSYIKGNNAFDTLRDEGHAVLIHTLVTGGQALGETLNELRTLSRHFPDVPLVVWLNPYFGEISMDGQKFQEFKFYKEASANIKAIIEIPHIKQVLFAKDMGTLLARKWSFEAGVNSSLPLMSRQRFKNMWRNIHQAIDQAGLV